jgi:hypothetical protein
MPELGYNPTNHYLPPRITKPVPVDDVKKPGVASTVKQWVNKAIAR